MSGDPIDRVIELRQQQELEEVRKAVTTRYVLDRAGNIHIIFVLRLQGTVYISDN